MADDLKKLTVVELRELARKQVGRGYSRLKTKADLLAALSKPGAKAPPEAAAKPRAQVPEQSKGKPAAKPIAKPSSKPLAAAAAAVAAAPAIARAVQAMAKSVISPPRTQPAEVVSFPSRRIAEPLVEGFFVARVAGEAAAARHHLTEDTSPHRNVGPLPPPPGYDEHLGELPDLYGDDATLLLPRDPHTLFFLWDFASDTRSTASQGLSHPRARLRVFEDDSLVREIDFALESRSFYIHGLPPGRRYRVEAHFVGEDGRSRRIGPASNAIQLPREGPSSDLEVRFMRVPWNLPLSKLRELLREFQRSMGRLEAPARISLPSSDTSSTFGRAVSTSWVPPASGRP